MRNDFKNKQLASDVSDKTLGAAKPEKGDVSGHSISIGNVDYPYYSRVTERDSDFNLLEQLDLV